MESIHCTVQRLKLITSSAQKIGNHISVVYVYSSVCQQPRDLILELAQLKRKL